MLVLNNRAEMSSALKLMLPANLHALLTVHINHTVDSSLEALTRIIVVLAADDLGDLDAELGFSILWDIDGTHWTDDRFAPRHDWLGVTDDCFVAICCAGNSGFASVVLVENRDDQLGDFCRHFSIP